MTAGIRHWLIVLAIAVSLHAALLLRLPTSSTSIEPAGGEGGIEINLALVQRAVETPATSPSPVAAPPVPQPELASEPEPVAPVSKPAPVSKLAMKPVPEPVPRPVKPAASLPQRHTGESPATPAPKRAQSVQRPRAVKTASTRQAEKPVQERRSKPPQSAVAAQPSRNPFHNQVADDVDDRSGSHNNKDSAKMATGSTRAGGRHSPGLTQNYLMHVSAYLNRFKEYPYEARLSRQEGIVKLRFTIDRSGRILNYQIERGTGFPLLNQQALYMLEKANPLPPMPNDLQRSRMEVVLPVAFSLN